MIIEGFSLCKFLCFKSTLEVIRFWEGKGYVRKVWCDKMARMDHRPEDLVRRCCYRSGSDGQQPEL